MNDMADAPAPITAPEAAPAEQAPVAAPAQLQAPAPETPAPNLPPRWNELGQRSQQRLAERQEQEQREADRRDAAAYREQLLQRGHQPAPQAREEAPRGRRIEIDPTDPGSLRAAFGDDAAFRAYLTATAKHVVNPDAHRLAQQVKDLASRVPEDYEDLRGTVRSLAAQQQAAQAEGVRARFLAATEAPKLDEQGQPVIGEDGSHVPAFPLYSRLSPEQRVNHAVGMMAELKGKGFTQQDIDGWGPSGIAQLVEEYLEEFVSTVRPLPKAPPAPAAAAPFPSKRPQGGPPKRSPQGTRSLTNDDKATQRTQVSERDLSPREREKLRDQRALDLLAARASGG